jgi:elongation factor G
VRCIETIRRAAEGEGKYIRQTGGGGNYGHVRLRIEPIEAGMELEFASQIRDCAIPEKYIAPIEEGVREAARGGIIFGEELTGARATLIDGSWHQTDSNEMAFRIAGSLALKEAGRRANPVALEPMMTVIFTVPQEHMGTVVGDINGMMGRIEMIDRQANLQIIHAIAPLRGMVDYEGPGKRVMIFSCYEPIRRPPDTGDAAGTGVRMPHPPRPRSDREAADPESDWV